MKNFGKLVAVGGFAALLSTSALAATVSIKQLPDSGNVTIAGTVSNVKNEREFTLRDETGTIDVNIKSGQSVVLKEGAKVSVDGTVDKGILGKDINATNVTVDKSMSENVTEGIEKNTNLSMEGAQATTIAQLPKEGKVKLSGTVTDVDNEKEFTLKDSTGSIDVDLDQTAEAAALKEGSEVTVIGYVDDGMTGKDINATKVMVISDTAPSAGSASNAD
ncbi:MAG: NirD/YgiW/YdeI family stress tolerance protein [Rickettsiales bacterium]